MRIGPLRNWLTNAVQQSTAAARRMGHMIGRKIRDATGSIGRGVGVGDDESEFGGGRNRGWIQEIVDDAKKKLLTLFERSFFERFPRFQRRMRALLGTQQPPLALPQPKRPPGSVKLGAHTPASSEQAEAFRRQIEQGRMQAHTREHAGLLDRIERHKRDDEGGGQEDREQADQEEADSAT